MDHDRGGRAVREKTLDALKRCKYVVLTAALGIAMYAMFIALLMPSLHGNGRLALLVVFTAAINALLSRLLTPGWALVVATLVGAAVGVPFVELPGKELYHED